MKRKNDIRHKRRIDLVQTLFARSFANGKENRANSQFTKIEKQISYIDPMIEKAAPQFPLDKIAKIDVAILRLAIFELMFEKKEPAKVIIDEAIELAKEFGGEASPAFINGVLGAIYKSIKY